MASALVLLLVLGAGVSLSSAEVYKVGDSTGWTIEGNPNYTAWASSKTFHVGDTILFEYNKQYHSVLQVNRADYRACSTVSPLATHTSGMDSIPIKTAGHHLFICGFPGHCGLGQKVDIRVLKNGTTSFAAPLNAHVSP